VNTSMLAMGIASVAVAGLIGSLVGFNLFLGAFEWLFGWPQLIFLRSTKGPQGFAFAFKWNSAKEPAQMNQLKIRIFNPFGKPTQMEVTRLFESSSHTFARDVDLGKEFVQLKNLHKKELR